MKLQLSDEALHALTALAERYNTSEAKVLEVLILDRYSVSDMERNKERKREARIEALKQTNDPRKAFNMGYNAGWLHFQTRHGKDVFIEEAK